MKADDLPAYHAIKAQLIDRTGHHYYIEKDEQLRERIGQRVRDTGAVDLGTYRRLLDGDNEAEWRRLESAVTINETFFFRFAEQFAALRGHILPELIRRRAETRRLRIWSAGCSTGAEPYSLAVLVHDLLGDSLPQWQISILGTDIDEVALEAARAARFGEWALRTVGEADRDRLFIRAGRHWTICPQYRALVRFERHNLLDLEDGDGALQLADFDLILCRNVLIYFSIDRAVALVDELGRRIAEDGWLLIGHAEPGPSERSGLVAARAGAVIGWRRLIDPAPLPSPPSGEPRRRSPAALPTPLRPLAEPLPIAMSPPGVPAAREAFRAGLLDQALAEAAIAVATDPLDPVAHFLRALALAGLGRSSEALTAFGRALYLDPGFVMAHYLSAVLLTDQGEDAAARRAYRNAAAALSGRPLEERLAEGEGMTVADLDGALRWRLKGQPR